MLICLFRILNPAMRRCKTPRALRHPHALAASGRDGGIEFTLQRRATYLYVNRLRYLRGAGRVQHTLRFADEAGFLRWCQADRLQFDYPVVYDNLKRAGSALLSGSPPQAAAA